MIDNIEKMYFIEDETVATWWDPTSDKDLLFAEYNILRQKDVVQILNPNNKKILDLCTGRGRFAADLALNGAKFVVACDLSKEMLNIAKNNFSIADISNISLIRCDAEHLPFKEKVFDAVICMEALIHIPNPKIVINEMVSALHIEGILIVDLNSANPFPKLLDPIPISQLPIIERTKRFFAHLLNYIGTLIFDFAWSKTRLTNKLYYLLFNAPVKYYTKRTFFTWFNDNGLRIVDVRSFGKRLTHQYRIFCKKGD